MQYVTCNFCDADDTSHVLTGRDLWHGIPGEFSLVQCNHCGLMYINPQPTPGELETYYPEDYEAHVGTKTGQFGWLHRLDYGYGIEKRRRAIERYIPPGRMLDIGCATGAFLNGMRQCGWEVVGIEPNRRAAIYAQEGLGLLVQNTTLEAAQLIPATFDLVTMWNVLEHLSDPRLGLERIAQTLRPGGLLVFAIPNTESYDLAIFKKYWAGYDLPRHLFVFPPATLEKMVKAIGFEVLKSSCVYGTYNALAYSVRFVMNAHIANKQFYSILTRLILSLPARALMLPASWVVGSLRGGSIMTWFCRKAE